MGLQKAEELAKELATDPLFGDCINYILSNLGSLKNTTILDSGCGSGDFSVFFATLGASVIGVDKQRECVENSVNLATSFSVNDHCLFVQGSAESLPIQSESVDLVFSKSTIQYMDRQQALDEYLRVLKPEGVLVLIENLPYNPFINIYRLHRRITSKTPAELEYINSIRGYITLREINTLAKKFQYSGHQQFHFFRVISIYIRLSVRENVVLNKLDSLFSILDKKLFRLFPFLTRFAWFSALYCEKKTGV